MIKIKIKKYPHKNCLSEIFQSMKIKLCFVNRITETTYKQVHQPVHCRDFLNDIIWARYQYEQNPYKGLEEFELYGFSFDYKEQPIDGDKLRLHLKFSSAEEKRNFKNNIGFLHEIENRAGTKNTQIYSCVPLGIIIEADSIWQSAPWKLSLYTFFLKLIAYENPTEPRKPEDNYLCLLTEKKLNALLSKIYNDMKTSWGEDIYHAHNYQGFVSIIEGKNNLSKELLDIV